MRIIKHGDIGKLDPVRQWTCYYCGCEFECRESELKKDYDQRENDSWYEIDCPTCTNRLILR